MSKFLGIGEILLRLSTPDYQRFEQTNKFDINFGGGEANVTIALANLGVNTSFITKVPNNEIGKRVINELKKFGVDTSYTLLGGERIGIYYLEKGYSIRGSKVIYDRNNSAMATANENDFDFENALKGVSWLHISGITPTISEDAFKITEKIMRMAKQKGIKISFDLNYRKNICTYQNARERFSELMNYVNVCFGIFPFTDKDYDIIENGPTKEELMYMAKNILERYKLECIISSYRTSLSASKNKLEVFLYDGKKFYNSESIEVDIVDRVGAGDAMASGFIYALINNMEYQQAVEYANAAFALKHTILGDQLIVSVDELESIKCGNLSGKIKR